MASVKSVTLTEFNPLILRITAAATLLAEILPLLGTLDEPELVVSALL